MSASGKIEFKGIDMSVGDIADMLHMASWKECVAHLTILAIIPETYFEQMLDDERTLANHIADLEGLSRFVLDSLMGNTPDEREATFVFNPHLWSSIPATANKAVLLSTLEITYEELQRKILACSDSALLEHGRPMWTPAGMYNPAAAILQLIRLSSFQRGQLARHSKESP